jgi:acyl dehydratase
MQQAVENALAVDREAALRDVYAGVALGGFIAKGFMTTLAVEEAWYAADLMLVARRKGR